MDSSDKTNNDLKRKRNSSKIILKYQSSVAYQDMMNKYEDLKDDYENKQYDVDGENSSDSDGIQMKSRKRSGDSQTYDYFYQEPTANSLLMSDECRYRRKHPQFSVLPLEWWERSADCKLAKSIHTDRIDSMFGSREELVNLTTLSGEDIVLEPNMFPYDTPPGVAHYTLWGREDLNHYEIIDFVDEWLLEHLPQVRRWQYDDNCGERSILLFHVHVFIETIPFSFHANPEDEYFPPHLLLETQERNEDITSSDLREDRNIDRRL